MGKTKSVIFIIIKFEELETVSKRYEEKSKFGRNANDQNTIHEKNDVFLKRFLTIAVLTKVIKKPIKSRKVAITVEILRYMIVRIY